MKKFQIFLSAAFVAFTPVILHGAAAASKSDSTEAAASATPTPLKRMRHRASHIPSPSPTPAPVEKKRSWFYWLFHHKPQPAAVSSTPSPSPTPIKKHRPKAKPTPAEEVATPTPEEKHAATKKGAAPIKKEVTEPTPTPAPKKSKPKKTEEPEPANGLNEPVPFVPNSGTTESTPSIKPLPNSAQEMARFRDVKAKALADPHVKELQEKSDNAAEGDEQQKASREYYRALFNKMRRLDPSLKERIDRTEAATLRRL